MAKIKTGKGITKALFGLGKKEMKVIPFNQMTRDQFDQLDRFLGRLAAAQAMGSLRLTYTHLDSLGLTWTYNRPPEGDRSEGSYMKIMFLIEFPKVFFDFPQKSTFYIWDSSRNKVGNLEIIFESHFGLQTTLKKRLLDLKTNFPMFQGHILDLKFHF